MEKFIAEQDTELLFGTAVNPRNFNDDALGNALDRIHKKGTLKLFTEVSLRAATVFELDTFRCSFDTTSVNVWGDYNPSSSRPTSSTKDAPKPSSANGQRKIVGTKYHHRLHPEENTILYEKKLKKAGCFVMITNTEKEKMPVRCGMCA